MPADTQPSLFDEPAAALVTIKGPKATQGKAQREFNRLTNQLRRQRELLAAWDAYAGRYAQRMASEFVPAVTEIRNGQWRLVTRIDELLRSPIRGERLSRKHRAVLRDYIAELLDDLLADDEDDEQLRALHDKYADFTRAEMQEMDMELAEAMASDVFGADVVHGHGAQDVESLMEYVRAKVAARTEDQARQGEERAAARAAKKARPTKAEQAAERRAQAAKEASQSVREVYRKLASELHPDRETDAEERQRKTLLMQRVNQAYERNDLMELLTLQIEIEQIDAEHLAGVSEQRLQHYNQVLRE